MIIVPINHFGHSGLVRPVEKDTCYDWNHLQIERLEELMKLDLPWRRVGIAHLQWFEVEKEQEKEFLALEDRYFAAFSLCAARGVGIELNAASVYYSVPENREEYEALRPAKKYSQCVSYDKLLWLFGIAKRAGCKFYIGSDSHTHLRLDWPARVLPRLISDLVLEESDKFIPERS